MNKQPQTQVKLDPFTYGTWDVVTTLVQLAVAVAGVILAAQGDTSALLGLGALAGGAKSNLLQDLLKASNSSTPKTPRGPRSMVLVVFALALLLPACGTTISRQFLVDSQTAVKATAQGYFDGCRMVTIAPAFSVSFEDEVTFGGGLFAGCEANGELMEFRCVGVKDEETGKTRVICQPIAFWLQGESAR